jgi:hypothetical protein
MEADVKDLKIEIIQWLTSVSDKKTLAKVEAIRQKSIQDELTPAQELELGRRLDKYLRGEMKFKSWDEVKRNVLNHGRNAKD